MSSRIPEAAHAPCPFCAGSFLITLDDGTLMHSLPCNCPIYLETDPLSFVELAKEEQARIDEVRA